MGLCLTNRNLTATLPHSFIHQATALGTQLEESSLYRARHKLRNAVFAPSHSRVSVGTGGSSLTEHHCSADAEQLIRVDDADIRTALSRGLYHVASSALAFGGFAIPERNQCYV